MNTSLSTSLARLGEKEKGSLSYPKNVPIALSSVYVFDSTADLEKVYENEAEGYIYTRSENPVHEALKEIIKEIDNGEAALVYSSGMAAITMTLISHLKAGDHVIASSVLYGESHQFLKYELSKFNIHVSFVDFNENLDEYFEANTKLVYMETISNPLLQVSDIKKIAECAHKHRAKLMVDNTFATPVICRPLNLGADIVVYSATKYLCGHGDVMGGIVVSDKDTIKLIGDVGTLYGPVMSPFDAWILIRSLKTLELRVKEHSKNALKLANYFESKREVKKVYYPGLKSSEKYSMAKQMFNNELYGGMLSIDIGDDEVLAGKFIDSLDDIKLIPSLADIRTSVCCPARTSHRTLNDKELKECGISKGLIRISAGIENIDDLINEFEKAFNKLKLEE